eukprot:gene2203-5214_t
MAASVMGWAIITPHGFRVLNGNLDVFHFSQTDLDNLHTLLDQPEVTSIVSDTIKLIIVNRTIDRFVALSRARTLGLVAQRTPHGVCSLLILGFSPPCSAQEASVLALSIATSLKDD